MTPAAPLTYQRTVRPLGGCLVMLCPFHDEKTPSMRVNPVTTRFACIGCGVRGDARISIHLERTDNGRNEMPRSAVVEVVDLPPTGVDR